MTNEQKATVAVLKDIRNYIQKHGWTQRVMQNVDGEVCLLGALNRVDKSGNHTIDALYRADAALRAQCGRFGIVAFNDAPTTTKAEVLHLVQKTIDNMGKPR